MANKLLAGITFGLTLIALGLTVGAIYSPHWVDYEAGKDHTYEYGLFTMSKDDNDASNSDDAKGTSWSCTEWYYCEFDDEYSLDSYSALCDLGKDMAKGALIYYITHILAICFMAKQMICQLAIMMDRDGGSKFMLLCKASTIAILSTVGFGCWWGLTGASYSADCDYEEVGSDVNDGDKPQMCAGTGATIMVIAFAFTLLAAICGLANAFMQGDLLKKAYSEDGVMGCAPKIHMGLIKFLFFIAVTLSLVGICLRNWVHFEIDTVLLDDSWDGGLFSVADYDINAKVNVDAYGWDCLAVIPCDQDDDTTTCKTFEPLMNAGRLYLQLEVANLVFIFQVTAHLYNILHFKRDISHPVLVHGFAHLAWVIHLVAIICWTVMSRIKFKYDDCSNDDTDPDERYDVCIRAGPIISIIQLVVQMIAAIYLSIVYMKRGAAASDSVTPETKQ